jgi:glycerol-3-phosphate dehydrogenase
VTRDEMLARVRGRRAPWDVLVIGGGATGVGVAIDAASRGYDTLLLERADFGSGTSSRSTKLVHGGVRYLAQGKIALVREALLERALLRRNAPHLVAELAFVVPSYSWWEKPFYGLGFKVYDLLAGGHGFGRSRTLTKGQTLERLPAVQIQGLRGGVLYFDGQFDDARLLINLVATAAEAGATLVNRAPVVGVLREAAGRIAGVVARDEETGEEIHAGARIVVNAAGPFCDDVRRLAEPSVRPMITPSQGIHLVIDGSFLDGDCALMVPHTSDRRLLFAIPWHGRTLLGTTDTPIDRAVAEPRAREGEIDFVLATAGRYLRRAPSRDDVLSVFVGIRPLVRRKDARSTAALSRDHTIQVDGSGLLTITGGKWTTYRNMAEDAVNQAAVSARLPDRPCVTRTLAVHGAHTGAAASEPLAVYGTDAPRIAEIAAADPALAAPLHAALTYTGAEVVWAVRAEMARTVEDVLSRRMRALVLDARAAIAMAPRVAALMAAELDRDDVWVAAQVEAFRELAAGYLL